MSPRKSPPLSRMRPDALVDAAKTWQQIDYLHAQGCVVAGLELDRRPQVTAAEAIRVANAYREARRMEARRTNTAWLDAKEARYWEREAAATEARERRQAERRIRRAFAPRKRHLSLEDIRDGGDHWDDPTADEAIFRIEFLSALSPSAA